MSGRKTTGGTRSRAAERRRTSTRIVAAVVVSLLVAVTVLTLAPGNEEITDTTATDPTTTSTQPVELDEAGRELLALLEQREEETYHARYEAPEGDASAAVVETWQAPPNIRQDRQVVLQGQTASTSQLVTPDGAVLCIQTAGGPWTCRPAAEDELDRTDPAHVIRDRVGQGQVTAFDSTVEGRDVRCFRVAADDGTTELCVLPDRGIPVTITAGTSSLRLVVLDDQVTDEVFTPPAPVTGAG